MARVIVTRTVRVGARTLPVKEVPNFASIIRGATAAATATQLRVMAEEAKELLIDRLYAAHAQPPGQVRRERPPRPARRADIPTVARRPAVYVPLTSRHVARKKRLRQDGRFLIATGDYTSRGIEVFRGQQAPAGVYYMIRPKPARHRPSGIAYSLLARVHEFGSAQHNIPPRPHWRPAARDVSAVMARSRPSLRAAILREVLRRVR